VSLYGFENAANALRLIHRCIELCTTHREALSEVLNEIPLEDRQDIYNRLVLEYSLTRDDESLNELAHANHESRLKAAIESVSAFAGLSYPLSSSLSPSTTS
jgi:hypothetical protein